MLTTRRRKTVAIRRRTMKAPTVGGTGTRPGSPGRAPAPSPALFSRYYYVLLALQAERRVVVHPVVRLNEHVGELRAAVEQRLGVHPGQDSRVLHHLHVDLGGVGVAGCLVVGGRHLLEIPVDDRIVQL